LGALHSKTILFYFLKLIWLHTWFPKPCDAWLIYQSISDENTKEDDEKEAGTQTGPSLNNCKDRGQAISHASHGFGNQVRYIGTSFYDPTFKPSKWGVR
jgi:hypothetical protein